MILTGWILSNARARARDESYKACFVRHHIVRSPLNVRIHISPRDLFTKYVTLERDIMYIYSIYIISEWKGRGEAVQNVYKCTFIPANLWMKAGLQLRIPQSLESGLNGGVCALSFSVLSTQGDQTINNWSLKVRTKQKQWVITRDKDWVRKEKPNHARRMKEEDYNAIHANDDTSH